MGRGIRLGGGQFPQTAPPPDPPMLSVSPERNKQLTARQVHNCDYLQ